MQNIQKLLALMRQTTFGGELRDTITGISTVAENLVMVAQETLEGTDR